MADYELLKKQLAAFADEERDYVPLLANASALLFEALEQINWAGFYLVDYAKDPDHSQNETGGNRHEPFGSREAGPSKSLLLGPFQGKSACIRIQSGKGVCGTALSLDRVQRVADVHEFPGHIACDSASRSEIVIPIHSGERIVGVLDIDSPIADRFDEADEAGLCEFVRVLEEAGDFSRLAEN